MKKIPMSLDGKTPLMERLIQCSDEVREAILQGDDYKDILQKYQVGVENYEDFREEYGVCYEQPKGEYSLEECFICLTFLWRTEYWNCGYGNHPDSIRYFENRILKLLEKS